jgi:hypothetical protein
MKGRERVPLAHGKHHGRLKSMPGEPLPIEAAHLDRTLSSVLSYGVRYRSY